MPSTDANGHTARGSRRQADHARTVTGFLLLVGAIVLVYGQIFHLLMASEGRQFSWFTGVYWTLETMTTLGYGDLTFKSDTGMAFAVLVLMTGIVLLFVLLPFTLIQFVYAPWLERRNAARTPHTLGAGTHGHVILTAHGPIEDALIQRLTQYGMPYVVIVADSARAMALHDRGVAVMVGAVDDAHTYVRAGVDRAALVATTLDDAANANVALSVRECNGTVPIIATSVSETSVDLLRKAGCRNVIQVGELLGRAMAGRIASHGGRTHVIGRFDGLLIAEAAVADTTLLGQTLQEAALGQRLHVNIVGIWERGEYSPGSADLRLTEDMTLLLSGTQEALDAYDQLVRKAPRPPVTALIIGGGRVGRAVSWHLTGAGIDHRIVEKAGPRTPDSGPRTQDSGPGTHYVIGDATDPGVLLSAGLATASSVAITTHDDDLNVYLTLSCRAARPDITILSRATLQHNVGTLRRAGADFVMSYVPMEANAIFDVVRHGSVLSLAEGLEVFTVPVPSSLVGTTIAGCNLRRDTGCNVLAVRPAGGEAAPPDIHAPLPADAELVLIGDRRDERLFFERYADGP